MPRLCPPARLDAAMTAFEDDPQDGLERLAELARRYAKDPAVQYGYGVALLDSGRTPQAVDPLELAERKQPDEDVRDALLDTYFELGMVVHAERLLGRNGRDLADEIDVEVEMARNHGPAWRDVPRKDLLAFERARVAVMRGDDDGVQRIAQLTRRQPTWLPPWTALAALRFTKGDLEGFYAAADGALEAGPRDAQALVHAARAALLRDGQDAARALRDRLDDAASHRGVLAALAARAEAAAVMDDEDALRVLLRGFDAAVLDADGPPELTAAETVGALRGALDRRDEEPDAPLARVSELLAGVIASWVGRDDATIEARVCRDLALASGLLRELPHRLGFEDEHTVRILAGALLFRDAPPPPQGEGETWAEILARIASVGPGSRSARVELLTFLVSQGVMDENERLPFDGSDDGVTVHGFEVTGEPTPSSLSDEDQARADHVLQELTQGRLAPALAVLPEMVERYPEEASISFNLALAERLSGRQERGRERMERLLETHPDYLFVRAQLAVEALEAGDLARAEELLVVPTGRARLHVHEWAAFAGALGRLQLARGDVDGAESYLETIERTAGEGSVAYRMLEDAVDAQVLGAGAVEDEVDGEVDDEVDDDLAGDLFGFASGDEAPDEGLARALAQAAGPSDPDAAPAVEEVAELPRLHEAWHLVGRPVAFPIGSEGELRAMRMLAIAADDGYVRTLTLYEEELDGPTAYAHLATACVGGMSDAPPGRPDRVVVEDGELAAGLNRALQGSGIDVVRGEATPALAVIEAVAADMGSGMPPILSATSELEARRFLGACDAFYSAQAWDGFAADRPLAFRVGSGPWRYATLMGHGGEEFGLAMMESWDGFQAFSGGDLDADQRFDVAGAFESVSLSPLGSVSPLDTPLYLAHGLGSYADDEVPMFLRHERGGLAAPSLPLSAYGALLELLAQRARRVHTRVRRIDATVDTPAGPLRVRYPATGGEAAEESGGAAGQA
ncbi:MAG: hypothetical protein ABR510_12220 [Trueperaceae bacterium]